VPKRIEYSLGRSDPDCATRSRSLNGYYNTQRMVMQYAWNADAGCAARGAPSTDGDETPVRRTTVTEASRG
jgi:hypothetical protein